SHLAYAFTDAITGNPADLASVTAAVFPAMTSTTRAFYEGLPAATKSTSTAYEYDSLGRVTRAHDFADDGADDDVVTTYQYASCPSTYVLAPSIDVVVASASGAALEHRQSTVDCATGDVTQSRAFIDGQSAAVTD